ncbi:M56 family metallopeptidase [Bacteroides heparinolyticus]|uniref:M56 family metallopeptidase n=1 Tax=Prevotella heparinolytica TaxID=28113 RepID=UPI0028EEB576|nr:M56 family metallopeptidase [Bacteroides heparinolyticus]
MSAYFLKVNVAIAIFYAFYRLFFYKDTFFGWRRATLLCFFAISAAVPLLNIQAWITAQEPMAAMAELYANVILPEFTIAAQPIAAGRSIHATDYIGIIYGGIAALLVMRIVIQIIGIGRLACQCYRAKIGNTNILVLRKAGSPFSFFHWIFIHPSSHTEEELNEILTHEQTHARQWHSIDVVIGELACALCWFNPFVWLMKREIRTNLEYMADARVLENGYDSKAYQYHLLGLSHQKAAATIYNNFNVLPLKKRIKMMNKARTKEIGRTKYLIFLPLTALLMIVSNIETVARTTGRITAEIMEAVDIRTEQPATDIRMQENSSVLKVEQEDPDNRVFEVVDHMPEFPDGSMSGLMSYLSRNIKYPVEAQKANIQGRVVVGFIVEKDGSITHTRIIRGAAPSLDAEALRVIGGMPKWKPGRQGTKVVRVKYTVPVTFSLGYGKNTKEYAPVNGSLEEVVATGYAPVKGTAKAEGTVFEVVEQMPEFPGGLPALMRFLSENIKYPVLAQKAGTQGKVTIRFIVDTEGNITNPEVVQGVDPLLDAEAIRVISGMPKWKPGKQRGEVVNVRYALPVTFRLQKPEKDTPDK